MKRFKVTNEMYKNGNVVEASRDNYAGDYVTAEIVDDEIVVTDDEENEVERFINFEIED